MIDREYLKEKILDIHDDFKKLHLLQREMDDKYRIPALEFWKIVSEAMQEKAKIVQSIVGENPVSPFDLRLIRLTMDQFLETYDHAQQQILLHGIERINN